MNLLALIVKDPVVALKVIQAAKLAIFADVSNCNIDSTAYRCHPYINAALTVLSS